MAFYDWNHDGKKDGKDNFFEYNMYKESKGNNNYGKPRRSSSGNMSTFEAILCVVGGLVLQALIYTIFDIEVDDVPAFLIIVLWIVFGFVASFIISLFKH